MRPEGTEIHKIVRSGDLKLLEFCLFGESDPQRSKPRSAINLKDRRGMTPLHAATTLGKRKIVEYLVNAGCNMNSKDKDDNTALHIAAAHGHIAIAQILLSNGTSVNGREKVCYLERKYSSFLIFYPKDTTIKLCWSCCKRRKYCFS